MCVYVRVCVCMCMYVYVCVWGSTHSTSLLEVLLIWQAGTVSWARVWEGNNTCRRRDRSVRQRCTTHTDATAGLPQRACGITSSCERPDRYSHHLYRDVRRHGRKAPLRSVGVIDDHSEVMLCVTTRMATVES